LAKLRTHSHWFIGAALNRHFGFKKLARRRLIFCALWRQSVSLEKRGRRQMSLIIVTLAGIIGVVSVLVVVLNT
jgi:hypothetical protein